MKATKSDIMKKAHQLFSDGFSNWSDCLKESWSLAKQGVDLFLETLDFAMFSTPKQESKPSFDTGNSIKRMRISELLKSGYDSRLINELI